MGNLVKNFYHSIEKIIIYYYEKLCQKEIFIVIDISDIAIKNNKKLNDMNQKEKLEVLESFKVITTYNSDFSGLKEKYLENSVEGINLQNFKGFIKNEESGFYIKMAIWSYIIRLLITISHFLLIVFFLYPKYICLLEEIKDTDKYYWNYNNKKNRIKIITIDSYLIIRIINFVNDIIIFICEIFILVNLEKIRVPKKFLKLYQVIKYSLFTSIIISEHLKKEVCYRSIDENIFHSIALLL